MITRVVADLPDLVWFHPSLPKAGTPIFTQALLLLSLFPSVQDRGPNLYHGVQSPEIWSHSLIRVLHALLPQRYTQS